MQIDCLEEFEKDLKKLRKKYKTIDDDLNTLLQIISTFPDTRPDFSFQISDLGIESMIIKVKKFHSKSFKGRGAMSGFRLIYCFDKELETIILVELYHKNESEIENRDRILQYFS